MLCTPSSSKVGKHSCTKSIHVAYSPVRWSNFNMKTFFNVLKISNEIICSFWCRNRQIYVRQIDMRCLFAVQKGSPCFSNRSSLPFLYRITFSWTVEPIGAETFKQQSWIQKMLFYKKTFFNFNRSRDIITEKFSCKCKKKKIQNLFLIRFASTSRLRLQAYIEAGKKRVKFQANRVRNEKVPKWPILYAHPEFVLMKFNSFESLDKQTYIRRVNR